jgi:hypothetical protein
MRGLPFLITGSFVPSSLYFTNFLLDCFSVQSLTAQQSRNQSVCPFTPKAFANFSPGLERSDNPGITALLGINNAESVGKLANSFRVENASLYLSLLCAISVSLCSPWLMIYSGK